MSRLYCIYNNIKFKAKYVNNKIRLISDIRDDGFENYVDVLGNKHNNLFVKEIRLEEAELLYREEVTVKYKEEYFQLYAGKLTRSSLENNLFMIFTDSEHLAEKYMFEKKEQFVFVKYITKEEVKAVKIKKQPMYEFSHMAVHEDILQDDELKIWFDTLY